MCAATVESPDAFHNILHRLGYDVLFCIIDCRVLRRDLMILSQTKSQQRRIIWSQKELHEGTGAPNTSPKSMIGPYNAYNAAVPWYNYVLCTRYFAMGEFDLVVKCSGTN